MTTTEGPINTPGEWQQVGGGRRRAGSGTHRGHRLAVGLAGLAMGVGMLAACSSGSSETTPKPSARLTSSSTPNSGLSAAPSVAAPSSSPGRSATSAPSAPPVASTSAAPPDASTSAAPTAPAPSGSLRNLVLTQTVRDQLVRAYVIALHYQPEWITSTRPGSVYYAFDAASNTSLAWAAFQPALNAPEKVMVGMQDGGIMTAFHQRAGAPWEMYDICTTPAFLAFVGGVLPAQGHC